MDARTVGSFGSLTLMALLVCGCTSPSEYIHNGFKVGPNYKKPPAPVAEDWIDATDQRLRKDSPENVEWWSVFGDPVLDNLVKRAARENLTLKEAGQRVLEFRANLAIQRGNFFPQTQNATGSFQQNAISANQPNTFPGQLRYFGVWDTGFNLSWELDFWGRFRRAIEAADASLNASIENYDDVMVTLIGDVASSYVQVRTLQTRIKLARDNVFIQKENYAIANAQFKAGKTSKIDVDQSLTNLGTVEALIPQLEIQLRQVENNLCVLLGIPPQEMDGILGSGSIPQVAPDLVVGIPAQLLTRRPDIRRAEREAAAQSARIGIAESDFYPAISVIGSIGVTAEDFGDLFNGRSLSGNVGPSFQWNILNYGRILNNVRLQDARFQGLIAKYQQTVLSANAEVENAIVAYLKGHQVVRNLAIAATAADEGVKLASVQYKEGKIPFVVLATLQQNLVSQQDQLAQAYGSMVLGLVQTYRALGGGWQIRLRDENWIANLTPPRDMPNVKLGDALPPLPAPIPPNPMPGGIPPAAPPQALPPQVMNLPPAQEFVLTVPLTDQK